MTVTALFPQQALQPTFEAIWQVWPNKSKKPLALARYTSILHGCHTRTLDRDSGNYVDIYLKSTEAEIEAGVKAYLKSQIDKNFKLRDDGKYIPHLATFLNGGRYLDLL